MQVYPDTPYYAINYISGTCGMFLHTLIASMCVEKQQLLNFSEHGNAHSYYKHVITKNKQGERNTGFINRFLNNDPINPTLPIIDFEHRALNYDLFFTKFPKGKIIIIQIEPSDYLLYNANFYFKCLVDNHSSPIAQRTWDTYKDKFFDGATTPFSESITDEMIMKLIRHRANNIISSPFAVGTEPKKYSNIAVRSLKHIYQNKNETLEWLSEVTGMPVTDTEHNIYDAYLKAQIPILSFLEKYS